MLGKKLLDMALLGASTLVTALALAVFIYTQHIYEKPTLDNANLNNELVSDQKAKLIPKGLVFEKVIMNIKSHRMTRLRYLETQINLIPLKSKHLVTLEKKKDIILDAIIRIAGNMNADQLNSISGKLLLENRIKKEVDQIIGSPALSEIYFSKFIIQ